MRSQEDSQSGGTSVDILLEIYRQSNDHLRASDSKRDQLIAFYSALLVILFKSWNSAVGFPFDEAALASSASQLWLVLCVVLGLLGVFISLILIAFRKWHIVYVNTAMVAQYLAFRSASHESISVEDAWNDLFSGRRDYRGNKLMKLMSVEAWTQRGYWLISFIPIYILMKSFGVAFCMMFFYHAVYFLLLEFCCNCYIEESLKDGYECGWLLRSIKVRG